MKLTKREKVMLVVLVSAALITIGYYLVYIPQTEKLESLQKEQVKYAAEVAKVKLEISPDNRLNKDLEALNLKVESKTTRFYPGIIQEKLIITLDGLFKRTRLVSDNMTFTAVETKPMEGFREEEKPAFPIKDIVNEYKAVELGTAARTDNKTEAKKTEPKNEPKKGAADLSKSVEKMSVTAQFVCSYEQLMQFIKGLEGMSKTIVINSLTLERTSADQLKGTIVIDFYAIPKVHEQDKEYLEWAYNNQYGAVNPFRK